MGPNPFYGLGTVDETKPMLDLTQQTPFYGKGVAEALLKPKTATAAAREPTPKVSPADYNARVLGEIERREAFDAKVDDFRGGFHDSQGTFPPL